MIKTVFFPILVLMVSFPKIGKGIEQKACNGSLNMDLIKQIPNDQIAKTREKNHESHVLKLVPII